MPQLAVRSSSGADPGAKRRKIRKGTHSCWECRRRKLRCQFSSDEATICVGCKSRGTTCMSQEFPDEQPSTQDAGITQRLSRVENLLEKLVERVMPDVYSPAQEDRAANSSVSVEGELTSSSLRPSTADHPPVPSLLEGLREGTGTRSSTNSSFVSTPASTYERETLVLPAKHVKISKTLHATFPCQHDIDSITSAISGPYYVLTIFHGCRAVFEGRTEPPSSVSEIPLVTSHPALLAKRLMQLVNCMQQLQPASFPQNLVSKEPIRTQMSKFVSVVSDLVVSNDDLVGSVEGLESMYLVALYHANAGNLRKGWLVLRRLISVAQLMGLDKLGDKPLKSVDPKSLPSARTGARTLWFRINFSDRFLSLLLGLPAASDDNSFAGPENSANDEPVERLEKFHTVIMGAIIKRNYNKSDSAFSATQSIDCDLEIAAKSMDTPWWQAVTVNANATLSERMQSYLHIMMQMNHHHLLILLHLPYMMRDHKERRWDYSKTVCLSSSRELLRTFFFWRRLNNAASACRHTDYGALTAAMTLLLGYLDPKFRSRDEQTNRQREADRNLVQEVKDRMQDIADRNTDKLARESADIIGRLLPLMDVNLTARDGIDAPVRLDIPYVGTININPIRRVQQDTSDTSSSQYGNTPAGSSSRSTPTIYSGDNGEISVEPSMPTQVPSFLTPPEASPFSSMQFETDFSQMQFSELAAEVDQWTFQGFDTTFFDSFFNNNTY
ncbi:hypothetical protein F5B20DRAFT_79912 [Whalleya microplaca]|nr:hypothetical protein F5B20DRAFT_79912 [Whalleya microplaca]